MGIKKGVTTRRFVGHKKDVLSCAFSAENRQIVSGSRDKTVKLWNTLGECKFDITENGHTEWVSCVRFSPQNVNPLIVSCLGQPRQGLDPQQLQTYLQLGGPHRIPEHCDHFS